MFILGGPPHLVSGSYPSYKWISRVNPLKELGYIPHLLRSLLTEMNHQVVLNHSIQKISGQVPLGTLESQRLEVWDDINIG